LDIIAIPQKIQRLKDENVAQANPFRITSFQPDSASTFRGELHYDGSAPPSLMPDDLKDALKQPADNRSNHKKSTAKAA
jgi:hypothetical protein